LDYLGFIGTPVGATNMSDFKRVRRISVISWSLLIKLFSLFHFHCITLDLFNLYNRLAQNLNLEQSIQSLRDFNINIKKVTYQYKKSNY
jgi:hypothetical protein